MTKSFVSNTEELREFFEEPLNGKESISASQVWRDSKYINNIDLLESDKTESINGEDLLTKVYYTSYLFNNYNIKEYHEKIKLNLLTGTSNVFYYNDILKNYIDMSFGDNYLYKIYLNDIELPFGRGNPELNAYSGYLRFTDEKFINQISDTDIIRISFYKYIGRVGFIGDSIEGSELPLSDDKVLLQNKDVESKKAQFLVRGDEKLSKYILPSFPANYYEVSESDTDVIVLQKNFNKVLNAIGDIDGGLYW